MRHRILLICLFLISSIVGVCANKKPKGNVEYKYEIESYEGNVAAKQGYTLIKVWSYGKREDVTRNLCMRNAIHGILFKGYSPKTNRSGDRGKKPLVPNGYASNKAYFDHFFEGDYLQYIQVTNNGAMLAGDMIKISKKEYKIGMVVSIDYDGLRKRLEKDQIIKKLDFLF